MQPSVLLIITGSIAAYKTPDLVRRLRGQGISVTCVLTKAGAAFVTPLSLASVSGQPVYDDLWSLKDETEMGHIRLSREHDLIAVVPASADMLAKMASGRADDLASAILLAADKPVLAAPAMNTKMWEHIATQRNIARLKADGVRFIEPEAGELACGETGQGRLASVDALAAAIAASVKGPSGAGPLAGRKAVVTSGPTYEPIDPVRFIANRSSGKQGHAIASALADAGAEVTLVTGPVALPDPANVTCIHVETTHEMLTACEAVLPADVFIGCAAVSDWRARDPLDHKIKKRANDSPPDIKLALNPDIVRTIAASGPHRPRLVVGFAAETESLEENAEAKRESKGCDWIVANSVADGAIFGADDTAALLLGYGETQRWDALSKQELARRLTQNVARYFSSSSPES